jgi:hypothetical protein
VRPTESDRPVWFVGQDIVIDWELYNGKAEAFEVAIPSGGAASLLGVTVIQTPVAGVQPQIEPISFTSRLKNAPLPSVMPVGTFHMASEQVIYLRARLRGADAPGDYEIQLRPAFAGPHAVIDRIKFERRVATSRADLAEVAFRRVARAFSGDDCRLASVEIVRLLSVHPYSSSAYYYQAECARRDGRREDAMAAYAQARDMLEQRLDDLLIANKPDEVKSRADGFAQAATGVWRVPVIIE